MESWCSLCDWHAGPLRLVKMFFFFFFLMYKNNFTIMEVLSYKPN